MTKCDLLSCYKLDDFELDGFIYETWQSMITEKFIRFRHKPFRKFQKLYPNHQTGKIKFGRTIENG